MAAGLVPAVMIVMNIAYSLGAYPAGRASDRLRSRTTILAGLGVLTLADLLLALATSPEAVMTGAVFWGFHLALTQGFLS